MCGRDGWAIRRNYNYCMLRCKMDNMQQGKAFHGQDNMQQLSLAHDPRQPAWWGSGNSSCQIAWSPGRALATVGTYVVDRLLRKRISPLPTYVHRLPQSCKLQKQPHWQEYGYSPVFTLLLQDCGNLLHSLGTYIHRCIYVGEPFTTKLSTEIWANLDWFLRRWIIEAVMHDSGFGALRLSSWYSPTLD